MAAADGKLSEHFSPLENEWDRQDQLRWFSRDDPPPLQQPELLKWRHWRPGKIREMEPTTQGALELHMCGKWAERLLAHFAPFAEHIAYMQDILGRTSARKRWTSWGIAGSGRGFTVIPWQERHVRSLLNQLADEEVTPCKLRQVWNTLKWFSKTFGLLKIHELHRLKSKKSSLEEALTDTVTRPQRKAVVPSKEVIWALEEGAGCDRLGATGPGTQEAPGKNRHEVLDAFILGFARFQVGCSARFNDLQHVHPKDLTHTSNTVELKAWQTKTVRINRNRSGGPPGWPRSGGWYLRRLSRTWIPTVSKDFVGLITGKGFEMAQRCYSPPGCHPGVGEALVPGDCAFQMGIPRERRMYLGNWLTESTADVYVREKRNVVVEIWGQVAQKVPNLNLGPGKERREDLNHPDWADPLPPPAVDITDAGPEGREDQIEKEGEASPSVPSGSAPSARSWSVVEHEPGDTPVKAKDLFPATPDLPLRVVAAVKRTGNAGQSRIHLLNVEGTAVGCGWRPAASKVQELLVLDYRQVRKLLQAAWVPGGLGTGAGRGPTLQEDSDSSAD